MLYCHLKSAGVQCAQPTGGEEATMMRSDRKPNSPPVRRKIRHRPGEKDSPPAGFLHPIAMAPLPLVVLTLVLALVGCGPTTPGPDAGCSVDWPARITLAATGPSEEQYLAQIVACSSRVYGETILTNGSGMVWALSTLAPRIRVVEQNADIEAFHFGAESLNLYGGAFLAPGETISLGTTGSKFELVIHPDLSAAWLTFGELLSKIKKSSVDAFKSAVTKGSTVNKAVWNCTSAVFSAGKFSEATAADYDPLGQISAGLGSAASTTKCAVTWRAAAREAGLGRFPPWDDVVAIGKASSAASEFVEHVSVLEKAAKVLATKICSVLPGC